ncbi:glucose-6-phosphate dehydrogenase assembly protein OpcA [Deinococcus marmoris]|uniref:OpcA, an allosteric effector of glucose-6-phosphate dehydrogenase, cyanobacterial n=1 Tax=Deinococcus marmoris TaxID=249408 RepID=A0A1U7NTW5_9DEIO|nr:glucose-6-phosphate dehydrogenase assembly protein OpcA [Deinococcus marmoris]OLV16356.1 OpcA, an allosteric effector of glucose-6-phosphate dehydrogenase, cyanobacterial [Deinococcus marmoris]
MTAAPTAPTLGPVETSVRKAQITLDELWSQTNVETRAYTGNIIALTVRKHLERVQEALAGLEGRYAGRQIIGVMDGTDDLMVHASLVSQRRGAFVERLTIDASTEQLQGAILPLLRPATVNHVWWGSDTKPEGLLMRELTDIADQVIADSLTLDIPPARHYALADLGWSRSASWREALAQVFDSPDAARQLPNVDHLTVRYAGGKDLPARLYAGFVADTLGWKNLENVEFKAARCGRENGDLCGVELSGDGVRFTLAAGEAETVRVESVWDDKKHVTEVNVPTMSLAEGLGRVMARPERGEMFERAWKLAKATL